eukprot:4966543-Alexandrium_andersonii.AAC.1
MESLEELLLVSPPAAGPAPASPTAAPAGSTGSGSTSAEGACTPTLWVLGVAVSTIGVCRRG